MCSYFSCPVEVDLFGNGDGPVKACRNDPLSLVPGQKPLSIWNGDWTHLYVPKCYNSFFYKDQRVWVRHFFLHAITVKTFPGKFFRKQIKAKLTKAGLEIRPFFG